MRFQTIFFRVNQKKEESKCSQPGRPDVHVDLCSSFYPTFLRHFSVEVHKSSNNLVVTNFLEVFQLKWPFVTIWLVVVEKYPRIRNFKSFSNWVWLLYKYSIWVCLPFAFLKGNLKLIFCALGFFKPIPEICGFFCNCLVFVHCGRSCKQPNAPPPIWLRLVALPSYGQQNMAGAWYAGTNPKKFRKKSKKVQEEIQKSFRRSPKLIQEQI